MPAETQPVSRDGRFVYASNRGANSMQVYSVDDKTGKLTPGEGWLPMNQPSNVTFLP